MTEPGSGPRVVFCRETVYGRIPKLSTEHLADAFVADGWNVLWLTRPLNPFSLLRSEHLADKRAKLDLWRHGPRRADGGALVYAPLTVLPYRRRPGVLDDPRVAERSLRLTVPPLKRVVRAAGFRAPDVLWISDLAQVSVAQIVRPRVTVLHVTDDYTAFPGAPRSAARVMRRAAERADVVVATHPALAAQLEGAGAEVHYVPHGVEEDLFAARGEPPPEYASIPSPRAVFAGSLADWMDWRLLVEASERLPEVSFVVVGGTTARSPEALAGESAARARPNVHCIGPRSRARTAALLQHADVGIIPFLPVELKRYSNPMKIYEYLACGLPVVSTLPYWEWTGLVREEGVAAMVRHAPRAEDFAAAIRELASDRPGERARRVRWGYEFAGRNGWRARYEQVLRILGGRPSPTAPAAGAA